MEVLKMKKLTTRWYFTLKEIAELYNLPSSIDGVPAQGFGEFCGKIANVAQSSPWFQVDTTESRKMWADYLWPEFADASILYVDELVDPWEVSDEEAPSKEEVSEVLQPMLPSMVRWLRESTERYSALIGAYEGIKNKLMGKVETVSNDQGQIETSSSSNTEGSDSRLELHNDTPQSGGDFTTDPYVSDARKTSGSNNSNNQSNSSSTNSSTTTVSSDVTTPIERLNEVREKLHNLYADWAEEFAKFVIYTY